MRERAKAANYGFKPGRSGNPSGRPVGSGLTPDVRRMKEHSKSETIRVISECLLMSKADLAAMLKDPASSMIQMMVGSVMVKAVEHSDAYRLTQLLDYVVGRPRPMIEDAPTNPSEDADNAKSALVRQIPTSTLLELVKASRNAPTVE